MMLKKVHVLLLSALCFYQHGLPVVEAWIGSGVEPVESDEFPFSVALIDLSLPGQPDLQYFCGGTLITKKHVLTSAHCLDNKVLSNLKVLIGSPNLLSPEMIFHDIYHFWTYESWAQSRKLIDSERDMAVLTLEQTTHVKPITLSPLKAKYLIGKRVGMASWGLSVNAIIPDIMEKAYANILSRRECLTRASKYVYSLQDAISRFQVMCNAAVPTVLGTCGNSGSPVFDEKRRELVGIHKGVCTKHTLDDPPEANLLVTVDSSRSFIRDATQY